MFISILSYYEVTKAREQIFFSHVARYFLEIKLSMLISHSYINKQPQNLRGYKTSIDFLIIFYWVSWRSPALGCRSVGWPGLLGFMCLSSFIWDWWVAGACSSHNHCKSTQGQAQPHKPILSHCSCCIYIYHQPKQTTWSRAKSSTMRTEIYMCVIRLKEMATHSSILTWRIPGMGEPGGLPSMGSHRVGHD